MSIQAFVDSAQRLARRNNLVLRAKAGRFLSLSTALCCLIPLLSAFPSAGATDLVGVYHDALIHDPLYREARARYQAAQEAKPSAWAAFLPHIDASAGKSWDKSSGSSEQVISDVNGALYAYNLSTLSHTSAKTWSINLSDTLFSWKDWMSLKRADKQVAEAQANYEAARENLLARSATAYFGVLQRLDALRAEKSAYAALSYGLSEAKAAYSVGLTALINVQQAEAARDRSAAVLIHDQRLLANAENRLQTITGRTYASFKEPGSELPLISPQPAKERYWVDLARRQNLHLIAKELALDAARLRVRGSYGADLPEVHLVASRSYSNMISNQTVFGEEFRGLGSNENDAEIGLEVTVPLFDGGADRARTHKLQYEEDAASASLTYAAREARQGAEDAYLGVLGGIANVKASKTALASNRTVFKAVQSGFKAGAESEMTVLDTLSNLMLAESQYSESRYSYLESIFALKEATGTLTPRTVFEVNRWLTRSIKP